MFKYFKEDIINAQFFQFTEIPKGNVLSNLQEVAKMKKYFVIYSQFVNKSQFIDLYH